MKQLDLIIPGFTTTDINNNNCELPARGIRIIKCSDLQQMSSCFLVAGMMRSSYPCLHRVQAFVCHLDLSQIRPIVGAHRREEGLAEGSLSHPLHKCIQMLGPRLSLSLSCAAFLFSSSIASKGFPRPTGTAC